MLVGLHVSESQQVNAGTVLCTVETTKSAADVLAESPGFVVGLRFQQGDSVRAGDLLCYLAETPDWQPVTGVDEPVAPISTGKQLKSSLPISTSESSPGLRITQPALELARQTKLDLNTLPRDRLVTKNIIRALINDQSDESVSKAEGAFDTTAIIVYGGGGHGKAVIDLLRSLGVYRIMGVLDDGIPPGELILGVPVMGGCDALPGLYAHGFRQAVNAVGGIGNITVRIKVFEMLAAAGFTCPTVVHPTAFIEQSASLSPGVQVFPHAYVGSAARVGYGCIVNTGAIVSHDCILGDYANIAPGALLAGEVQISESVLVGMGVTINLRVNIGEAARLGNNSTIISDVPPRGIVRAGKVWAE